MKKILLSFLFVFFSISMNAQNIIERETIQNNPNTLSVYSNQDVAILSNNFSGINENQKKDLYRVFYKKYKTLVANRTNDEIVELVDSTKSEIKNILGNDLYTRVSQNNQIFNRLTGSIYLNTNN